VQVIPEIRFVYFDLGNVLVAFDPEVACANVAALFAVDRDRAHEVIYASGLQTRFEHGQLSGDQYADVVRRQLGRGSKTVATEDILEAISAMFWPIESMADSVRSVRASGIPIGVLSNTCVAHWQWILRQSYSAMRVEFEVTILSCEVGSMKPDAAIYQAAERAAGVPTHQILFLDDKIENVRGAQTRGWQSEQCLGGEQADAILRRYGVTADGQVG